ncbi:MAG: acyl carrier protein [Firmicutes bacterium HGW-Firmicutes-21]|nr:MAG: acyl carrier protein [Firmicutes bacterium HGW-Firmicutes-21]
MVTEKIIQVLAEQYDMDPDTLSADSSFEDMSFDSLDVAEMVMTLEDEYKVSIEMSAEIKTIGAMAQHIEDKMAQ